MSNIEAWVTLADGTYVAHLDRSQASPFRRFAVSRMRGSDPGLGSLEYHRDNALLTATPGLFADGSLVWMRYNGRTLTWIIEERKAVLDDSENATDWIAVSGRGVKQLLGDRTVWPSAFSETTLDPAAWGPDAQWYRVINRAAGELIWDLIDESNARFPAQLTRGTIETTGADGWTQDFRFDGLLDVVASVTAAYGDVEMDGLTFNYRNAPGVDRSASVIFEEGADVLRVERMTSDRNTITWIVAEGVGEGVTAKLAVAKDASATRRREAYLDAKDAGNLPLVQLRATAAIDELQRVDSIALEVTEGHFAAFTDYDLWDTVRVIAPSRGIDELGIIVAMYLEESDDERVRVHFDVNSPRQEYLIRLEQGNRSTASTVRIHGAYPRGQLVPYAFGGGGILDSGSPLYVFVKIPARVYLIIEATVTLAFRQFLAPATAAAASGSLTSDSGGGSTSGSGGATSSGLTDGTTVVGSYMHAHTDPQGGNTGTVTVDELDHHHSIASHTHSNPAHQHTVPTHGHSLAFGTFEESYPASHSVTLRVYERVSSTWTLRGTFAGLTGDLEDVDLTAVMTGPGDWRLTVQSAGGQPNGGRLGCDAFGAITGAIQSA